MINESIEKHRSISKDEDRQQINKKISLLELSKINESKEERKAGPAEDSIDKELNMIDGKVP